MSSRKNMSNKKSLTLRDNKGCILLNDDVVYDGIDYYRIYISNHNEFEMLSCTNGYMHNVQPKDLINFVKIGRFSINKHLFECD